jgi:lipoprotein NlpI
MHCLKQQTPKQSPNPVLRAALLTFVTLSFIGCAQLDTPPPELDETANAEQVRAKEAAAFERAVLLHREGDFSGASDGYSEMLVLFPNNTAARINLAQMEIQNNNPEQAKALVDDALSLEPNNVQALTLAGVIAREQGEFESAEDYYRKALSLNPNYIPALKNLGILLDLYRGRLAEALDLYEQAQALAAEPDPKLKDWIFDIKRRIGGS